jgi:hypothetical protein
MVRKNLSLLVIGAIAVLCIWNSFNEKRWKKSGIMSWDVACYYGYLPQFINGKSEELTKEEIRFPDLAPPNKYVTAGNGKKVLKTTMGMALLYLPFHAIGNLFHSIAYGDSGSGMEVEYRMAMQFFGLVFLLISLLLMRKILRRHFPETVVSLTLVAIALGTNVLYYTVYEGCMTHVANMALFLIFFLLSEKWHSIPSVRNSLLLGLFSGLLVLIRPTNILLGLIFLLINVSSIGQFKERIQMLFSKWHLIALMGIAAAVVWIPQIIYWHNLTGDYFFYSYVGEYFFFDKPKILLGFFSWRKGWLIYTPMAVLMLAGFPFMYKYARNLFLPVTLFYAAFVYVIFCWWCWWYGGSFSCRAMVDSYAFLVFPLASLFYFVFVVLKSKSVKILFSVILLLLISLNLFQTYQYKRGLIHYDQMTYRSYQYVFLKTGFAPDSLFKAPPWDEASRGEYAE